MGKQVIMQPFWDRCTDEQREALEGIFRLIEIARKDRNYKAENELMDMAADIVKYVTPQWIEVVDV